jgi:sigma-54 dependent transcriptional regulator, acetoin dehydrogenase operon transcriptional activator AcoR
MKSARRSSRRGSAPPQWNVAADHIELPYIRDPNLDTPLARSALPMLLNLRKLLMG